MAWTSYIKTFVRQWNGITGLLFFVWVFGNSSNADRDFGLISYVLGLGEMSDFASEILENDLSRNGGVLASLEKDNFVIWFDFGWIC